MELVSVTQLLAGTGPILVDFDGPMCRLFAGYPASVIAHELRDMLIAGGITVPPPIADESDPLEVLRWTAQLGHDRLARQIEEALCAAELAAAATAEPTHFATEAIVAAHATHRPVAVVSNNSQAAIEAYLASHGLNDYVGPIVGRDRCEPGKMKPHPEPIVRAVHTLDVEPASVVLIGDSASDILAARAARVRSIGYANRPTKSQLLTDAGADAVVRSMADIARALRATPARS
jgi:HAD superfamily hydrolase (TIGR01509 family)